MTKINTTPDYFYSAIGNATRSPERPMSDSERRSGLKDIWNAHMAEGASFGAYDIPFCPTTASTLPTSIITWDEAKSVYRKHCLKKERNFTCNAYVCFYIDDSKFDGVHGIWHEYWRALEIVRHFAGVITPDFSTYQDFPEAIKIYSTYRMRLFGYWLGQHGISVINNVRWGTTETWKYCFEGIPKYSIVAIGTVGGSPRKLIDRQRFEDGLCKMIEILHPHTIVVYGSAEYKCFNDLTASGISVISFSSKTAQAFARRRNHE